MKNKSESTSATTGTAKKMIPTMDERGVNTDPDWENKMRFLEEETQLLTQEYDDIRQQHETQTKEHKKKVKNLQQMIADKKSQHQMLLDKLGSLHLKLEHSNRKAHQKKFLAKKEALLTELKTIETKGKSLTDELEAKREALRILEEEHEAEKETLQSEITDLRTERDNLKKELEEGDGNAVKEEIAALELQREVYMSELGEWLAEAEKHIKSLRMNTMPEFLHQSLEWERKMAAMRNTMSNLQEQLNKMISQIRNGQTLEDLPTVSMPHLPEIPLLLYFSQPIHPAPMTTMPPHPGVFPGRPPPQRPPFLSGPPLMPPHPGLLPTPIARPPPPGIPHRPIYPPLHHHHQPALQPPHRGMPPPHRGPGPGPIGTMPQRQAPLPTTSPPQPAPALAPVAAAAAAPAAPAAPAQPSQLDKVLQMLGTRLPNKTRSELTSALQQIKSARGTLAGMAMEELCQQVAERLEHTQKPAMKPIGPPQQSKMQQPPPHALHHAPPQHPHLMQGLQPPPQRTQSVPSFCLVCQGQVDEHTQHKMRCSHVIHKQCVHVWLQSGTNKECPICPD